MILLTSKLTNVRVLSYYTSVFVLSAPLVIYDYTAFKDHKFAQDKLVLY